MRSPSRFALGLLLTSALFAVGSETASAYIYWSSIGNNVIGRSDLDGTNPNQTFITGATSPAQVASNGTNLYWANENGGSISRANLDGTSASTIVTGLSQPTGVAINSSNLYWNTSMGSILQQSTLAGASPATINASTGGSYAMAVSASHLYWSRVGGSIARSNLDGTSPNTSLITAGTPFGVAVYGDYVYWSNFGTNSIGRANLDGTDATTTFVTGLGAGALGVAVDAEHIYWVINGTATIGRANLDGTGVDTSFRPTGGSPRGVAVDPPVFQVSPTSKAFGSVDVGSTSSTQDFVVTNTGLGPMQMPVASLTGTDAAEFNITADTCTSNLDPAETCTVTAEFAPTAVGAASANLTFDYLSGNNGTPTTTDVALTGTGTAPPVPDFDVTPTSKDFGPTTVGGDSATQTFTVTNSGNADLTIASASLTGGDSSQFGKTADTCSGQTVAASASCIVTARFSPTSVGAKSANLHFTDNASDSPQDVSLSGSGEATPPGPSPTPAPTPIGPAPSIADLKVSAKRPRKPTKSLRFTFELSMPSTVKLLIQRKFGRQERTACKHTTSNTRLGKRCPIYRDVLSLSRSVPAGNDSWKIDTTALHPGAYRVTLVATDATGVSSKPARAIFFRPWWG